MYAISAVLATIGIWWTVRPADFKEFFDSPEVSPPVTRSIVRLYPLWLVRILGAVLVFVSINIIVHDQPHARSRSTPGATLHSARKAPQ